MPFCDRGPVLSKDDVDWTDDAEGDAPDENDGESGTGGPERRLGTSHCTLLALIAVNDALPGSGAPLPSRSKPAQHVGVLLVSLSP